MLEGAYKQNKSGVDSIEDWGPTRKNL
jgi:hypothetical protein